MFCCKFQNEIRTRFFCIVCGTNECAKVLWKNCATHPGFGALCNSKKYFCSLLTFSAACVPSRSRFQSWNYWNGEKLPYPSIYSRPTRFTFTVHSHSQPHIAIHIWSSIIMLLFGLLFISGVSARNQGQVVVGGWNGKNKNKNYLSSVELITRTPSDNCSIPDLPQPRYDHSLSLLSGGRLLVCGGKDDRQNLLDSCLSWVAHMHIRHNGGDQRLQHFIGNRLLGKPSFKK